MKRTCGKHLLASDLFTACALPPRHDGRCKPPWKVEGRLPSPAECETSLRIVARACQIAGPIEGAAEAYWFGRLPRRS